MKMVGYLMWLVIYVILIIINWKNHKAHDMAFWIANLVISILVQLAIIAVIILMFGIIEIANITIGGMLSELP